MRVELPCVFDGDKGIVSDNGHPQTDSGVCDEGSDGAETDDAERFALQFGPDELGFAFFRKVGNLIAFARKTFYPLGGGDRGAICDEHTEYDEFFNRVRIRAGRIEHDDAPLGQLLHGDIVDARTRSCDGFYRIGNRHAVHILRAHEDGVGIVDRRCDFIIVAGKSFEPRRGYFVERLNFKHIASQF